MPRLTNKTRVELLATLGFEPGNVTAKNNVVWEHPQSGCVLTLPNNQANEPPRLGDVIGIRAQLHMHGHLDEQTFNSFVTQGIERLLVEVSVHVQTFNSFVTQGKLPATKDKA